MAKSDNDNTPSGRQSLAVPSRLSNDTQHTESRAESLERYRKEEGPVEREKRLRALWKALPSASDEIIVWNAGQTDNGQKPTATWQANVERMEKLRNLYNQELMNRVGGGKAKPIAYKQFVQVRTLLAAGPLPCLAVVVCRSKGSRIMVNISRRARFRRKRNFGCIRITDCPWESGSVIHDHAT
jgi:hypothetical protein